MRQESAAQPLSQENVPMPFLAQQLLRRAAFLFCLLAGAANAQTWPARPIHLIVPFPPGGVTDIVGRIIAQRLSEGLGQPIVVENRGGGAGSIGAQLAAKSSPDGYTLLMATATHAINVTLMPNTGFDLTKDVVPVSLVASVPLLLAVNPKLPVTDVKSLVAYAKANPGKLNFASGSTGSASHLAGEMLKTMAGVQMTHIPYKGGGPALQDVIAGHVGLMFENMPSILPHVQAGRLRGIATTGPKRSPAIPELPTMIESGFPGFEAGSWYGLFAPIGTPPEVIERLHREVVNALKNPEMQKQLLAQGAEPIGNSPQEFTSFINAEVAKWAKAIKDSGAKAE
jgi:tripartite-type tricarboxylate transporter receptor subunit TctC